MSSSLSLLSSSSSFAAVRQQNSRRKITAIAMNRVLPIRRIQQQQQQKHQQQNCLERLSNLHATTINPFEKCCYSSSISSLSASSSSSSSSSQLKSQLNHERRNNNHNDDSKNSNNNSKSSSSISSRYVVNNNVNNNAKNNNANRNTGGLRRLPVVKSPIELSDKAKKVALRTKADVTVKNARNRARKHGTETINVLMQSLCVPLRDVVNGYKRELRRLHPFEQTVADLTIRSRIKKDGLTLPKLLDDVNEARKILLECGKEWMYKTKHAESAREANLAKQEGCDQLLNLYKEFAVQPLSGMVDLQRSLRTAPAVQLDSPAVVLVGAPNVGKSSIVRYISSATPEVNNYPFTTRGMTLGHVEVFWQQAEAAQQQQQNSNDSDDDGDDSMVDSLPQSPTSFEISRAVVPKGDSGEDPRSNKAKRRREGLMKLSGNDDRYAFSQLCQVMDSPGVLVREDDSKRNEMEELTIAAMKHLPTAVVYVMDLSGEAGDKCSSVDDQLKLRRQIRKRFPKRPWIDVVSKIDLGTVDGALEELNEIIINEQQRSNSKTDNNEQPSYIRLSIHDNIGIEELRMQVLRMLGEVRVVLDAMSVAAAAGTTATSTTTNS